MIIHVEKTFMTMHCKMCGRYFKRKLRKNGTLAKKAPNFFGPQLKITNFQKKLENPKLKPMNGFLITAIPP